MLEMVMFKKKEIKLKSHNENDLMDNLDMIMDYECLITSFLKIKSF